VNFAPESAGRTTLLVAPVTRTASAGSSTAEEWPPPDTFWQLRQAHWNIEIARPLACSVTAPQSQVAIRSSWGILLMARRLARGRARRKPLRMAPGWRASGKLWHGGAMNFLLHYPL